MHHACIIDHDIDPSEFTQGCLNDFSASLPFWSRPHGQRLCGLRGEKQQPSVQAHLSRPRERRRRLLRRIFLVMPSPKPCPAPVTMATFWDSLPEAIFINEVEVSTFGLII